MAIGGDDVGGVAGCHNFCSMPDRLLANVSKALVILTRDASRDHRRAISLAPGVPGQGAGSGRDKKRAILPFGAARSEPQCIAALHISHLLHCQTRPHGRYKFDVALNEAFWGCIGWSASVLMIMIDLQVAWVLPWMS